MMLVKPCFVLLEDMNVSHTDRLNGVLLGESKLKSIETEVDVDKPIDLVNNNEKFNEELISSENSSVKNINFKAFHFPELCEKVLKFMEPNETLWVIQSDKLICEYGSRLLRKQLRKKTIFNRLMLLGRFLTIIHKKMSESMSLEDFITSNENIFLTDYVNEMKSFDKNIKQHRASLLGANLRDCLQECADIVQARADNGLINKVKNFKRLMENSKSYRKKIVKQCTEWTEEEKETVIKQFKDNLWSQQIPKKKEIETFLELEPKFQHKNWTSVVHLIKNEIRKLNKWTHLEMSAVLCHFGEKISLKQVPAQMDIELCLVQEPDLRHKRWNTVRDFICFLITGKYIKRKTKKKNIGINMVNWFSVEFLESESPSSVTPVNELCIENSVGESSKETINLGIKPCYVLLNRIKIPFVDGKKASKTLCAKNLFPVEINSVGESPKEIMCQEVKVKPCYVALDRVNISFANVKRSSEKLCRKNLFSVEKNSVGESPKEIMYQEVKVKPCYVVLDRVNISSANVKRSSEKLCRKNLFSVEKNSVGEFRSPILTETGEREYMVEVWLKNLHSFTNIVRPKVLTDLLDSDSEEDDSKNTVV